MSTFHTKMDILVSFLTDRPDCVTTVREPNGGSFVWLNAAIVPAGRFRLYERYGGRTKKSLCPIRDFHGPI